MLLLTGIEKVEAGAPLPALSDLDGGFREAGVAAVRDAPNTEAPWPPPNTLLETGELVGAMPREDGAITDPNPELVPGPPPLEGVLAPNTELPAVEEVKVAAAAGLWLKTELGPPPSPGALLDI